VYKMFCLQCGTQLPDNSKFCYICGYQIPVSQAETQTNAVIANMPQSSGKKALVCEMCHSNNLTKEEGLYVCQSCGTKYTVEEARNLIVELTGPIKIDYSDEISNLYSLARRARQENNSVKASEYYSQIITKDPDNWEPNFFVLFYQACDTDLAKSALAINRVTKGEESFLLMLSKNVKDRKERFIIINTIAAYLNNLSNRVFTSATNYYRRYFYNSSTKRYFPNQYQDYKVRTYECLNMSYYLGDRIIKIFGNNYLDAAIKCWEVAINISNTFVNQTIPFSSRGLSFPYAVKDTKDCKQVAANYQKKVSEAKNELVVQKKKSTEEYWRKNAKQKADLQKEFVELQSQIKDLSKQKTMSDNVIKELKRRKSDVSVIFNQDAKRDIEGRLNMAMDENREIEQSINQKQKRIEEITEELNADRLFE